MLGEHELPVDCRRELALVVFLLLNADRLVSSDAEPGPTLATRQTEILEQGLILHVARVR